MLNLKKSDWIILGCAFSFALFAHFYRLGYKEFQGHEAYAARVASFIASGHWQSLFYFNHTPGRVLLSVPMFWLGWTDEFGLRASSALLGALTTILVFWLSRLLAEDRQVAWLATALFAVAGSAILQRMAIGVGPFVFFATLTACSLLVYLKEGKGWGLFIFVPAWLAACLLLLDGVMLGPGILFAFYCFHGWRFDRRFLLAVTTTTLLVIGFLAVWFYLPYRWEGYGSTTNLGPLRLVARGSGGVARVPFQETWRVLLFYNGWLHSLLLCGGLILGLFTLGDRKGGRVIVGLAILPTLYFSFHRFPTVHIAPFLPLLVVWSALGWRWLSEKNKSLELIISCCLTLAVAAGAVHTWREMLQPWPLEKPAAYGWGPLWHQGYRAGADFLQARAAPTDKVTLSDDPYVWKRYSKLIPIAQHKPTAFTTRYAVVFADYTDQKRLEKYYLLARVTVAGKTSLLIYEKRNANTPTSPPPPLRIVG